MVAGSDAGMGGANWASSMLVSMFSVVVARALWDYGMVKVVVVGSSEKGKMAVAVFRLVVGTSAGRGAFK